MIVSVNLDTWNSFSEDLQQIIRDTEPDAWINLENSFYEEEISQREELRYPPFGKIINIIISSETENGLMEKAKKYYELIADDNVQIYGPFRAPLYKLKKRYRYQIFVKGDRKNINGFKKKLRKARIEYNEKNVRVIVDVDPINLM